MALHSRLWISIPYEFQIPTSSSEFLARRPPFLRVEYKIYSRVGDKGISDGRGEATSENREKNLEVLACLLQTPRNWPILGGIQFPNQKKGCNRIRRPREKRQQRPWKTGTSWNSALSTRRYQREDYLVHRATTPPPTWVKWQINPTAPTHAQRIWK